MTYRIEDMPEEERPREKLEEGSIQDLTDSDLLALVLRTGSRNRNATQVASEVVKNHSFQDLLNVQRRSLEELDGISEVKSGQIKAVAEIARRTKRADRDRIEDLSEAQDFFRDMKLLSREKLRAVFLNAGNEVVGSTEFEGAVSSVSTSISGLFNESVSRDAAAVVLCHNHPSGRAEPTEADRKFTRKAHEAGKVLGVDLLDHLIAGEEFFSFRRDTNIFE